MYDIRVAGDRLVPRTIFLTGELDSSFSGRLVEVLEPVLATTSTQWVVVDLRATTLITPEAVCELADAHRSASRRGRVLILCGAGGVVADVLGLSGSATVPDLSEE